MIKFYLQYFKVLGGFLLVFSGFAFVIFMFVLLGYSIANLIVEYIIISSLVIVLIIFPFFMALGTIWNRESYYYDPKNFWERRRK